MGFYIETVLSICKDNWLIKHEDAERLDGTLEDSLKAHEEGFAVICVIDNGDFEAAGYAYDEDEIRRFHRPDGRPKNWVKMNRSRANELTGYEEKA